MRVVPILTSALTIALAVFALSFAVASPVPMPSAAHGTLISPPCSNATGLVAVSEASTGTAVWAQDASREGVQATAGSDDGVNLRVYLENGNDYNVDVKSTVQYICAGSPREKLNTSGHDLVVRAHMKAESQLIGACIQGKISVQKVIIEDVEKTDQNF